MTVSAPPNVDTLARSIGFVVDRTKRDENFLGNVWLFDNNKVATCAHLLAPYANYLDALLVKFPGTGKEYGVESIMFHPSFDRAMASQLLQESLIDPSPAISLQKYNAAVINLKENVPEINDSMIFKVEKNLSLPIPPREQGLGGNLREIDLFVVIQSITNARKEGVITICDERNYPFARLFCQSGRLLYAQYRNLINEMAIFQIVNRELDGNFFFWAANRPNWNVSTAIAKPADTVLIEAHRRYDELKSLVSLVGKPDSLFVKKINEPNLEILPTHVKDYCLRLWDFFDGGTPAGQLWQVSNLDDYAVYVTLSELKRTQQIQHAAKSTMVPDASIEVKPLSMAVNTPLKPYDEISNIHMDTESGRALVRSGTLLGTMREADMYHLLHNVRLVPEATGSPIFKGDNVVGMHCGQVPPDFSATVNQADLQGMIWVDSVVECLRSSGDDQLANELTLFDLPKGSKPRRKPQGGCKELAKIDCPKCGRTSLESTRFCKSCGQQLIKDVGYSNSSSSKKPIVAIVMAVLILAVFGSIGAFLVNMEGPDVVSHEDAIFIPDDPWAKLSVYKKTRVENSENSFYWKLQPEGHMFKEKDLIHLKIEVDRKAYVYLIYAGSGQPSLIYPVSPVSNKVLDAGTNFTFPSEVSEYVGQNLRHLVGLELNNSPGTETFMILASPKKLNLIGNSAAVEQAYKRAYDNIEGAHSDTGIEEPLDKFLKGLIANDSLIEESSGGEKAASQDSIYIDRYLIQHVK